MELIQKKIIKGAFEKLLSQAKTGDVIVLFKGPWDSWDSHAKGVVIRREDEFLLNGKKLLYKGPWDSWGSHAKGVVIERGDEFLLVVIK